MTAATPVPKCRVCGCDMNRPPATRCAACDSPLRPAYVWTVKCYCGWSYGNSVKSDVMAATSAHTHSLAASQERP